jgi:hypothetical protein
MRVGRLLAGLLFGAIALSILAGTHLYLARRLVLEPELPEPARSIALAGLAVLGASIFVLPLAELALPRRVVRTIVWPPSLWMGLMFLLLVALVVSDAALWIVGTAGGRHRSSRWSGSSLRSPSRKLCAGPWSGWSKSPCGAGRLRWTAFVSCRSAIFTSARFWTGALRATWSSAATRSIPT